MMKLVALPKSFGKYFVAALVAVLVSVGLVTPAFAGYNGTVTVTIHYNRATVNAASDFQGWYAYTFNATGGGTASDNPKWTQFASTDTFGGVATVTLNAGASGNLSQIGVIITDRATWTNANKDSQSGSDRFINITSQSSTEVWMTDASTTISTSDPKSPASPVLTTFKFHYDGSAPAVHVAARTKAFNNTIWLNGTWLKFDGTTANTTAGTDGFGKWVQYTLPYYTGQMDALFMIVANTDYTNKDGGNAGSVSGNRWIATTGASNAASSDVWLLTGDTTSWSGNAAFATNPYGSTPTITSVTNSTFGSGSAGKAGDTLTIAGTNLVPSNAIPARTSQPTVTIGGATATVSPAPTAGAASISVKVPTGLSAGAQNVVVTNGAGSVTSTGGFTLTAAPTITSLSSTTPVRGESITVNGTNLTGATFTVGGVAATVTTASATAPVITVPTSAPVAAGSVVATTSGGSASTSVTVTKGTPTLVAPTATGINYGAALSTSTLSGGSASINGVTVAGSFAWTTPTAVPTAGTASYSVTFTPTDTTGFNNNTTTTSLTVGKTTPTINTTPAASAITYGQTLASSSLTGGVASVAGSFAFATPATAPATGTASYSVTFTPTDTSNYNTTSFNVSVTTNKATPSVTATPTAADITYGAALSTATLSGGSASVAGSFAYVSPTAVPNAGTYSAAVRFTPTDTTNYNTVDFNINVSVAKVTPSITASPAPTKSPIRVGNTLSQIGLSGGGASVAGSFAYATPAATPAQGAQSVAVVFTPTDTTNYNSVNFNITVTFSVALPAITGLSPTTAAQGDLVTITGTDFDGVTGVTIGGQAATITTMPSAAPNDTSLVVRIPADQATGANNVILTTGAGSSSGSGLTVTAATPTITSLSATSGIRGDSITITGNFFNNVTAVKFGSVSATSYTTNSVTSISVTVPTAAVNGAQNVTVTADGGTSAGSSFTVNKTVPSVTATPTAGGITYGQTLASSSLTGGSASVPGSFAFTTPTAAPVAGTANQSVTFTPTNNTVYDTVAFNVSVTVSKATPSVTATPTAATISYGAALSTATLSGGSASVVGSFAYATPAATPGAGTADQSVTFTPTDTSNYNNVTGVQVSVTVDKATPTLVAPTAGGLVTGQSLSSSSLTGGSASNSGTSVAGSFAWTSPSTVPSIGTASYSVTFTPTDTANFNTNTANVSVTTYGVPTISSVNPTSGLVAASLTITGTYLSNATVTIGGASATVTANTATSITTTVPAGATVGAGNVTVTTAGGTVSSAFTVLAAPTISSLSAASVARGGTLTINGTNLGSASVTIGGTSATVTSNTATAVAVTVPTSLAFGSQSVVVTTAGGTATSSSFSVAGYSSATLTVHYNKQDFTNLNTYIHSWIQSGTGTVSGISVTGSFSTQSPETSVDALGYDSYGGVAKITYTGSNIQQVGFLVWTQQGPFVKDAGSASDRYRTLKSANDEIWIRNYDNVVSDSDPFSSINPSPNRPTTQTVVVHYDGNTTTYPKVYLATRSDLNDTAVNPYSYWVSPTYLDFNAPVTVSGPTGSSTSSVGTDAFGKYVSYTLPYNANHTTWANMIVGNAGLTSKDGGQAGTGNRYAALDASGTTHIWLVSGDTSSNSGNSAYTSNPYSAPVVSSLSSTSGKAGDSITITGTGLKPQSGTDPTVTIGGISATVTSASDTSVVVTVPNGLTDAVASAVVLSNAGGNSNSNKTFTVIPVPTISSLSITSGARGDSVTITGTGLTGASDVKFGSTSVASVTVNSATSLTVAVPSGASNGLQNVSVTTAGGTVTSTNAFTVIKSTPTVTATPTAAAISYGQ
ncbi:MAG: IPT/TIG domain-containing protein, partial [Actinomycetales bacterium]|nr:IPT/TIG domain-containing protein [Actinomycetales bacterium]